MSDAFSDGHNQEEPEVEKSDDRKESDVERRLKELRTELEKKISEFEETAFKTDLEEALYLVSQIKDASSNFSYLMYKTTKETSSGAVMTLHVSTIIVFLAGIDRIAGSAMNSLCRLAKDDEVSESDELES